MIKIGATILSVGLLMVGCGSNDTANRTAANNTAIASDSNVVSSQAATDANADPSTGLDAVHPKSVAGRANKREIVDGAPVPNLKPNFTTAPDDSQYAATMNSKGQIIETRIFRSHPQLAKAESIWIDGTNKEITVTLKNGRSAKRNSDKFESLNTASISALLEIAGVNAEVESPTAAPPNLRRR